ncbi:hypothetical protein FE257_004259 [Aspergillus nanangensis]|uniref:Heterokaryon incompatibility domain-containing protein n=1 Tax=Aspergillus nanangensis TaxID=2582783 RepID=A0AAD4GXB9_ASPNN|nr:hypothetical protein FE257_004259 [Aspergillus nanangensis]
MRLIQTQEPLTLQEFAENEIPKYAILSRRWEREEISFQEMVKNDENTTNKAGYRKIQQFCARALADGFQYAWVDTCCINKESSAELSEAINSMFRWYQGAQICYGYLSDVHDGTIERSVWFTRGWTLQELLAPREVLFLASDWSNLGSRKALANQLVEVTGIDEGILLGSSRMQDVSIARRMSWASQRQTTRTEDMAYCLMGIFDVNMPLLYGEGAKAFIRLQEEIMSDSDDQTLFAWNNDEVTEDQPSGLLARSPKDFRASGDIFPFKFSRESTPFALTNRGIRMQLPLIFPDHRKNTLILECRGGAGIVGIGIMATTYKLVQERQCVRISKSYRKDIPLRLLTGCVLDTIYILKAFSGSLVLPPRKQRFEDGGNPYLLRQRLPIYLVPPRGHRKKLIVCLDVGNKESADGRFGSNVAQLYDMLDRAEEAHHYYQGTLKTPLKDFVMEGYNFLVENYEAGDDIHLLGFSKGAYASYLLGDFVSWFEIIAMSHKERLPFMWSHYERSLEISRGNEYDASRRSQAVDHMKDLNINCRLCNGIQFMGLFDTANPQENSRKYWPPEMDASAAVFRHAVSIDERRTELSPILARTQALNARYNERQNTQELWFLGNHENLGAALGTRKMEMNPLSDIPLTWMIREAINAGLLFSHGGKSLFMYAGHGFGHFGNDLRAASTTGCVHDAFSSQNKPGKVILRERSLKSSTSEGPPRHIPLGAAIHASVLRRIEADQNYRPPNLTKSPGKLREEIKNWVVLRNATIAECYVRDASEARAAQLGEISLEQLDIDSDVNLGMEWKIDWEIN